VVREGVGAGGRNEPSPYAHMNNKRKMKKKTVHNSQYEFFCQSKMDVLVAKTAVAAREQRYSGWSGETASVFFDK
jgi:hypothetical protein